MRGGVIEAARVHLARNRDSTIAAFDAGSRVTGVDVVVEDTLERACGSTTCVDYGIGVGAGAYGGAVELTRFVVRRSAMCGVVVARGGAVDLHDGEVAENPIGVNVQSEGFDVGRLSDGVSYRDNVVNLDTSQLPVPDPASPF